MVQPDTILAPVRQYWLNSELVIGNLEGPLVNNRAATPGKCVLRSDPRWASYLGRVGIHALSLANNHLLTLLHTKSQ